MNLAAESLVAITGLWPAAHAPSERDRLAAYGLLERWKRRLARWLREPRPSSFKWIAPPVEKELEKKVLAVVSADQEEQIRMFLGDLDLARDYLDTIRNGRGYLEKAWPRIPEPGLMPKTFPLSSQELEELWEIVRVLDAPEILFDELDSYSITERMIEAAVVVYPELISAVRELLDEVLIEHATKGKTLSPEKEDLIRIFKGLPRDAVLQIETLKPTSKNTEIKPLRSEVHAAPGEPRP